MTTPAHASDQPSTVAIGLGSNLGDRAAHIRAALDALAALPGTTVIAVSSVIETDPVGPIPQGPYLNAAAIIQTTLAPVALLNHIHAIERARGRNRAAEQRWGPRTLDLDILLFGESTVQEPGLTIPHPRLHERLFVLIPLAQIAPDMPIPGSQRTVAGALAQLREGNREIPGAGSGTMSA